MAIPVGDVLRSIFRKGFFARILSWTKGITVNVGGQNIALDQKNGPAGIGESRFDSRPAPVKDLLRPGKR